MGAGGGSSRLYGEGEKLDGEEGKMERRKKGETDPSLSLALSYRRHAFKLPLLRCHIISIFTRQPYSSDATLYVGSSSGGVGLCCCASGHTSYISITNY